MPTIRALLIPTDGTRLKGKRLPLWSPGSQ